MCVMIWISEKCHVVCGEKSTTLCRQIRVIFSAYCLKTILKIKIYQSVVLKTITEDTLSVLGSVWPSAKFKSALWLLICSYCLKNMIWHYDVRINIYIWWCEECAAYEHSADIPYNIKLKVSNVLTELYVMS